MTTFDSNNARNQRDEDLNAWSLKWVLDSNMVLCVECGAAQFARNAERPFLHVDGCATKDSDKHPWIELRNFLVGLSRTPK